MAVDKIALDEQVTLKASGNSGPNAGDGSNAGCWGCPWCWHSWQPGIFWGAVVVVHHHPCRHR